MSNTEKLTLTVKEASELSGIGRDALYRLAKTPGFPAIRVGRVTRIHKERFVEWVEQEAVRGAVV